jgi:Outer membrane lipoprotein-sorting protein
VVYQILWPKERQGEAVLLRKASNQAASGSLFVPPDTVHPIDSSQMKNPLFGSDLSYADILENFFMWESQSIVGKEVVGHVNCQILESKPGKGQRSIYASVRSWVDPVRLVPLRVEKYLASGQLGCRVDTTRVVREDDGRHIPANLTVRGLRRDSVTELDGSRLKHDVAFTDQEFTPDGLKNMTPPRTNPP